MKVCGGDLLVHGLGRLRGVVDCFVMVGVTKVGFGGPGELAEVVMARWAERRAVVVAVVGGWDLKRLCGRRELRGRVRPGLR